MNIRAILLSATVLAIGCPGDECDSDSDCSSVSDGAGRSRCVHAGFVSKTDRCTDKSDCGSGDTCANTRRDSDGDVKSNSGNCVHVVSRCAESTVVENAQPGQSVGGGWHVDSVQVGTAGVAATFKRD